MVVVFGYLVKEFDEFTAADIREHLDGKVPKQAMPEDIEFIDEMPLTDIGTIDKKELEGRHEATT